MQPMQHEQGESDLPAGLAKPAQRALAGAGIVRLAQLAAFSEHEILKLHGMGPKAMETLRRALAARGMSFAAEKSGNKGHGGAIGIVNAQFAM